MFSIVTVCTGNICRSPMAEALLRSELTDAGLAQRVRVSSAGVSDEDWEALFAIDRAGVTAEADDTDVFLARIGAKVPEAVLRQHAEFRARL